MLALDVQNDVSRRSIDFPAVISGLLAVRVQVCCGSDRSFLSSRIIDCKIYVYYLRNLRHRLD